MTNGKRVLGERGAKNKKEQKGRWKETSAAEEQSDAFSLEYFEKELNLYLTFTAGVRTNTFR
jgi:hypothetical protein